MSKRRQHVRAGLLAVPAFFAAFWRALRRPAPPDSPTSSVNPLRGENEALRGEIETLRAELSRRKRLAPAAAEPAPDRNLRYPSGQRVPPGALPWQYTTAPGTPFLLAGPTGETREVLWMPGAGAVAVFRDVTESRNRETASQMARARGQTLLDTSRALAAATSEAGAASAATAGALALLPGVDGARALLYAYAGRGGPLTLQSTCPEEMPKRPKTRAQASPPQFAFQASSPLLWKLYVSRERVYISDIDNDVLLASSEERALLRGASPVMPPIRSAVFLPLLEGTTATGHLLVTSSDLDAFDHDALHALTLLVSLAALGVSRARLAAQVRRARETQDALWTVSLSALNAETSGALADVCTELAASALGAEVCVIAVRPFSGAAWQTLGTRHAEDCLPFSSPGAKDCPCDRVARDAAAKQCPAQIVGITDEPVPACHWRAFAGHSGTHSALSVPLPGLPAGALSVRRYGAMPFSPEEIRVAETFAALAGLALRGPLSPEPAAQQGA